MMRPSSPRASSLRPLGHYLDHVGNDPLLTADEERRLAEAIARGDEEARARMIRANLRLVVRIARDYLGRGLPLDDLVGEGNLGLIRAVQGFDPAVGTRFGTYASHWIKQSIRHALINTAPTIRLPSHMVGLLTRYRRVEGRLRRDLGHDPAPERVTEALGLSPAQKVMVERALRARKLRLDADDTREDAARATDEAMDDRDGPEHAIEFAECRDVVLRRMARLDDRERAIVSLRFGLDGQEPLTLKEVGLRLGVTREWVRKIEARAVRKLDDRAGNDHARTA